MVDPLFDLTRRTAVVTGGMGQLGAALAVELAARGMHVAILDRATAPRPGAAELAPDVPTARSSRTCATSPSAARSSGRSRRSRPTHGIPHLLVNAAGIDAPPDAPASEVGPFEDVPTEAIARVMDVNVGGVVTCCQVIGGAMARAGRGSIVNVSSIYGMLSPDQRVYDFRREQGESFVKPVAYSVSKSALYNLTRYLATYWARQGVRVNTLTLAGIANDQPAPFVEAYTQRMPIGRMMDVGEAVGAVVFLAADASSYVTGSNLVVDGGWSAW